MDVDGAAVEEVKPPALDLAESAGFAAALPKANADGAEAGAEKGEAPRPGVAVLVGFVAVPPNAACKDDGVENAKP